MWKRAGVVLVWLLATVGTASITLAAVSRVGGEVTQQAAVPIDSTDLLVTTVSTDQAQQETGTVSPTTAAVAATTIVELDQTTTSTVSTLATTTATTVAPATTTSTTAPPQQSTTTLVGGRVTVQVSGDSVTLVSAVPASKGGPWTVEVKDAGPEKVKVEFESAGHQSRYQAEVSDGELVITTEERQEEEEQKEED